MSDIDGTLKTEFGKHELSVLSALESSETKIKSAIQGHQRRIGWFLLRGWGLMLVGFLLLLSAMSGILWYQGTMIAKRQATLDVLKEHGGEIQYAKCRNRLCILMDEEAGEIGGGYRIPKGY
uniref:MbeB family mobilization protein n=1 Tax=Aeromonas sobria TaxID=646 RepID=UPI003F66B25B